ncbi:lactonase family protein [Saccharopolyspora taberi]|uniref:Lactonase family protein n=1 Tax=Saccharopolyspora taberi TaxID=60895 RepID=A0ABN3VIX2_9PSEU
MPFNGEYRMYVGAYTGSESRAYGIRLAEVTASGAVRCTDSVAATADPSFLALSPDGGTLFAVNEIADGRVVSFAVGADGTLAEVNSQPTLGQAPCHLSVHPSGRFLFTANYVSGNVVVHPIAEGGVLRAPCHVVQHSGSGPDRDRQEGPHAHQVVADPGGRHVLAVDLGADSVQVYDFDQETGHLALREAASMRAGSGPRHLAFHPSGTRFYLLNELASTMTEIGYDPVSGAMEPGRTLSMLPPDFAGQNLAAEVVVSPDGRFVYGSNRGHDSIAVFGCEDGFRLLDVRPAGVAGPRHIALSPDGRILFAAGQDSATVQAFAVGESGDLTPAGEPVPTPEPVCLLPVG